MGKVQDSFLKNMASGAVTRLADAKIENLRNSGTTEILPGMPVFRGSGKDGVEAFKADSPASEFVGIAVRAPSKVPAVYGANVAPWKTNDPVDVIVRGSVAVPLSENQKMGDPVYFYTAAGGNSGYEAGMYSTEAADVSEEGDVTIQLPNCAWRRCPDAQSWRGDGMAEIVIKTSNII